MLWVTHPIPVAQDTSSIDGGNERKKIPGWSPCKGRTEMLQLCIKGTSGELGQAREGQKIPERREMSHSTVVERRVGAMECGLSGWGLGK